MEKNDICYRTYIAIPLESNRRGQWQYYQKCKKRDRTKYQWKKGIEAAAAIGIIAGREELELEALSLVTEEQKTVCCLILL